MATVTMPETVQYTDLFRQCTCSSTAVAKYQKRISGPLLDRIDLHIEVPRLSEEELLQAKSGEGSTAIRSRVCRARAMQAERFSRPLPPSDLADLALAADPLHLRRPRSAAALLIRTVGDEVDRGLLCALRAGQQSARQHGQ